MKNTTLLLTIFFVSIRFLSFSQNEIPAQWCGTPDFTAEMMDKVQSATERYMNGTLTKSNMPYNIPITLHNMRNSDGSGGVDMAATFEEFCKAIEFYVQHDINLYIHDIKTHDNSGWTDGDPRDTGAWGTITFLTIDEESENTINIYGFEDLPGTCGYFQPSNDIIAFNCIGWTTIVHELGHYFALPHTFLGIDGGANCGVYVSNGEKVDGSNCATAADRICDTPPDNNTVRTPCSNGMGCQMLDSDSTAFFPDVTNIMSYFNFECRNKFTEGQRAVMHNKIEQDHTNLLVTDLPNTNPVTEATELIFPLNTETPYDQVLFTWNAVENANLYQIEINRLPNFSPSFIVETAFIEETQYNISNPLAPNITYYWRVLPLNKANPCTNPCRGNSIYIMYQDNTFIARPFKLQLLPIH